MPGHSRIFTAGEKEYETWNARKDFGTTFSDQLLEEFRGLCKTYNLMEYIHNFS
jgi:L-2-hydroxycarboxylate dehydrogenase (NAD+)